MSTEFFVWLERELGHELSTLLKDNDVSSVDDIMEIKDQDMKDLNWDVGKMIEIECLQRKLLRGQLRPPTDANFEITREFCTPTATQQQTTAVTGAASGIQSIKSKLSVLPFHLVKISERLAEQMKKISRKFVMDSIGSAPTTYQLPVKDIIVDQDKRVAVKVVDMYHTVKSHHIVIMLVGATGSGKTTLIDAIANYIYGVEWEDDFRFKLVPDEGSGSQVHSQTKWITAYTFNWHPFSPLPCTLTIIDTPGFGDTAGLQVDKDIVDQINAFFTIPTRKHGINHIHGIGFVTQASLARLTATQEHIFDSVLSIFGKDVSENIFLMTTFADSRTPPVIEAAKAKGIPFEKHFKFNNSALFADNMETDDSESFEKLYWRMGVKNFEIFFSHLETIEPSTLYLTKEVLEERKKLKTVVNELQLEIQLGLLKTSELEQEKLVLQRQADTLESNKDFTDTVQYPKQRKIDLPIGACVTNCLMCNFTCHFPCTVSLDDKKNECTVMSNDHCTACPQRCHWSKHYNNQFRFEIYMVTESRTLDDLKKKYYSAWQKKSLAENMMATIDSELKGLQKEIIKKIHRAQKYMDRLEEIALKPNPDSEIKYIDILISSEKQQHNPGWQERIKSLQDFKQQATIVANMAKLEPYHNPKASSPLQDSKWLEDIIR